MKYTLEFDTKSEKVVLLIDGVEQTCEAVSIIRRINDGGKAEVYVYYDHKDNTGFESHSIFLDPKANAYVDEKTTVKSLDTKPNDLAQEQKEKNIDKLTRIFKPKVAKSPVISDILPSAEELSQRKPVKDTSKYTPSFKSM